MHGKQNAFDKGSNQDERVGLVATLYARGSTPCIFVEGDNWQVLTPLEPQSRFGNKTLEFQVICPQIGTAALKGLSSDIKVTILVSPISCAWYMVATVVPVYYTTDILVCA